MRKNYWWHPVALAAAKPGNHSASEKSCPGYERWVTLQGPSWAQGSSKPTVRGRWYWRSLLGPGRATLLSRLLLWLLNPPCRNSFPNAGLPKFLPRDLK